MALLTTVGFAQIADRRGEGQVDFEGFRRLYDGIMNVKEVMLNKLWCEAFSVVSFFFLSTHLIIINFHFLFYCIIIY